MFAHTPKTDAIFNQKYFFSNKNIFFKTQGNRLGAIVAPNKRLEQALEKVLIKIQIIENTHMSTQIISNVN